LKAPKCRLCGDNHWGNCPSIESKVATRKKDVATIIPDSLSFKESVATSDNKVATIRKVSIRELNQGISAHFSNLPFEVTKNGKVIARVEKV